MRLPVLTFAALLALSPALAQEEVPAEWPTPEIGQDFAALPDAVEAKRQELIAAARSGDIEALRPVFAAQSRPPNVSFGNPDDPVTYLAGASSDGDGTDILGILVDILEMPYAYYPDNEGGGNYIWPYLAELDPTALTPEQKVDAYRLIDAPTMEQLQQFGGWIYWRAVINAEGELTAFVAGD